MPLLKTVKIIYVGSIFSHNDEFTRENRKTLQFPFELSEASILMLRHLGVLDEKSMTARAIGLQISESGVFIKFPQGDIIFKPEEWFWNLGTVENEQCIFAWEHYQLLLPELRKPRKKGARGKAIGPREYWEKRQALISWVTYYRKVKKLGHVAAVRKALKDHPELDPTYLVDAEAALIKATK